jgi:predicted DNA-binding transcriptional regulator YafY
MRRAERLFRLVNELRSRGVCRAEDLATYFEISVRTVYRDIAHLQGSGLPIEGEAGVGYLLRPGFDLPAMTFTFEQLDALAMGLSFVEVAGDTSLAEAAREVRSKIQASLPDPDTRKLENAPLFASRRDGPALPSMKLIRRAVRARNILHLVYEDSAGTQSDRRVRPLAIWAFTDGWLFAAWCELRKDFRAFRLDRIMKIDETGDQFPDDPSQNLKAYLATKIFAVEMRSQKA